MPNNFWAKNLAPAQPVQPQQQAGSPRAWWQVPAAPTPQQQPQHVVEQPQQYSTTRAQSANMNERCPECGSDNFFKLGSQFSQSTGRMESAIRCFDCGWPRVQEFSNAGLPSGQGEVVGQAKQLPTTGFHGNIRDASQAIARIG